MLVTEKHTEFPIFQYNNSTKKFEMLGHDDFRYDVECLIEDDDWSVYKIFINDTDDYNIYNTYEKVDKHNILAIINSLYNEKK